MFFKSISSDDVATKQVTEMFDSVMHTGDRPTLRDLFNKRKIVWRATGHSNSREFIDQLQQTRSPVVGEQDAYLLLRDPALGSHRLKMVVGTPSKWSDGQLPRMTFDYEFRINDEIQNSAEGSWRIRKTRDLWMDVR